MSDIENSVEETEEVERPLQKNRTVKNRDQQQSRNPKRSTQMQTLIALCQRD